MKLFLTIFWLLCCAGITEAAQYLIGSEALLTLTNSAWQRNKVGFAPADDSVQAQNPPIFKWVYDPHPDEFKFIPPNTFTFHDTNLAFRLQVCEDTGFSSNIVDVVSSNNFYNFIAPITNADGSTYSNTLYWRIVYLSTNGLTAVHTSAPPNAPDRKYFRFSMPATAEVWDRSMLGDSTYLSNKLVHPCLQFNSTNKADVLGWLRTGIWSQAWLDLSNAARSHPGKFTSIGSRSSNGLASTAITYGHRFDLPTNYPFSLVLTLKFASNSVSPGTNLTSFTASCDHAYGISNVVQTYSSPLSSNITFYIYATNTVPCPTGLTWTVEYPESTNATVALSIHWWGKPWPGKPDVNDYSTYLSEVACVRQLLDNTNDLAGCIVGATNYAHYYITNNLDRGDPTEYVTYVRNLAFIYDWLYNDMTTAERALFIQGMENYARYLLYQDYWYSATVDDDVNKIFPPPHGVDSGSYGQLCASHQRTGSGCALAYALAGYNESAFLREVYTYAMNGFLGQGDPFVDDGSIHSGRGYLHSSVQHNRSMGFYVMSATMLPEAKIHKLPFFTQIAEFLSFFNPCYFKQVNSPWGDNGENGANVVSSFNTRDVALLASSGPLYDHYMTENGLGYEPTRATRGSYLFTPYYYPPPARSNWGHNSYVNLLGGWAIASTKEPNTTDGFTNSIGIITRARPRGMDNAHGAFSEGDVEMWAYGCRFTDAGAGKYRKNPLYHNTLFVDGIGTFPGGSQSTAEDWYARLTAFTNTDTFTYIGTDITKAFNRSNTFQCNVGDGNLQFLYYYRTNKVPQVQSVKRNILFAEKKFFVLFDQLVSTQNSTFSWKWNVLEPGVNVETSACRFTYTTTNMYANSCILTVHVAHVTDPGGIEMTNCAGTNLARYNPITGEDYNLTDADNYKRWNNVIWVKNKVKWTNHNFLTVIYPRHWTNNESPTITRLDDLSVAVTNANDQVACIITFDTNNIPGGSGSYTNADYVIDAGAMESSAPLQTALPAYAPGTGTYSEFPMDVTNYVAESGAELFYKIGIGGAYAAAGATSIVITVTNGGTTLYSYATNAGKLDSDVASATYTLAGNVATPNITPATGSYSVSSTNATITCLTEGATIHWTTNAWTSTNSGSSPQTTVTFTNSPFVIAAYGSKEGDTNSIAVTNTITLTGVPTPPSTNAARGTIRASRVTVGRLQ